jgi:hypothetical protein
LVRHDLLQEHVRDTLRQIIPYERPKLAAIGVAGDQVNPMRVKPDLTKLTDEELDQLEKIVLKVGTGPLAGMMEMPTKRPPPIRYRLISCREPGLSRAQNACSAGV